MQGFTLLEMAKAVEDTDILLFPSVLTYIHLAPTNGTKVNRAERASYQVIHCLLTGISSKNKIKRKPLKLEVDSSL